MITSLNASIKLFASNYITMDQSNYEGTVSASIAYQDVSTDMGKEVFPGTFEGLNDNGVTVPFISLMGLWS